MRFYRPLQTPLAMTFDLDDTLYDNRPVIARTLDETHQALNGWHPALAQMTVDDYERAKQWVQQCDPGQIHDVTRWRYLSVQRLMKQAGLTEAQVNAGTEHVMQIFAHWRSAVNIPERTHKTLQYLSDRIPLLAITNGNADPQVMGIDHYFTAVLRAGPDGQAKPAGDMYTRAAGYLNISAARILHVGDDLITDVAAAITHGFQACWINDRQRNLLTARDARLIPHLEISRLDSLNSLV